MPSFGGAQGDPERGEKYARDLSAKAIQQLSDPEIARRGKRLDHTRFPKAQELPVFKRSYRILYFVSEYENVVHVLRFWHGHREEPFQF